MATPTGKVHTPDVFSPQEMSKTIPVGGDPSARGGVIAAESYLNLSKAEIMRFMEEPVEITVHESSDPNAAAYVYCNVNGEGAGPKKDPWIPRGVPIVVKRKHVAVLASAVAKVISTPDATDNLGNMTKGLTKRTAHVYPFSVTRDANPKGAEWLRQAMGRRG